MGDDGQRIELGELTELALDAATGDGDWTAVGAELKSLMNLDGVVLDVRELLAAGGRPVDVLMQLGLPDKVHRVYGEHFCHVDPVARHVLAAGPSNTIQPHELMGRTSLERTEYWNDFVLRFELTHTFGAWAPVSDTEILAFGGHRTLGEPFSRTEERHFNRIFGVIRRCARLDLAARQHKRRGDALTHVMGMLGHGVFFTDGRRRIRDANDVGRSILARADGLASERGFLSARDTQAQRDLQGAVARCANAATSTTVLIPRTPPSSFYLADVIGAASNGKRIVMLLIRDPAAARPSRCQLLQQAYGLTPAEARVADALADGLSPDAIAEQFEVTRGTVKNQLKQVFSKVGVSRQAELVRVIGSMTPLAPPITPA